MKRLIFALGFVAAVFGLLRVAPAVKRSLAWGGRIQGDAVAGLTGRAWSLALPPDRWYAARKPSFELTNGGDSMDEGSRPTLENRLFRIEGPAHLAVLSWKLPTDGGLDLDAAVARLSDASARKLERWKLLDVRPLPGRGATRLLHATARLEGEDVELLWGLYPDPAMVYGVIVAGEPRVFTKLRGEFEEILSSFRSGP